MRTLAGIVALMAVFTLAICFILIGSIGILVANLEPAADTNVGRTS